MWLKAATDYCQQCGNLRRRTCNSKHRETPIPPTDWDVLTGNESESANMLSVTAEDRRPRNSKHKAKECRTEICQNNGLSSKCLVAVCPARHFPISVRKMGGSWVHGERVAGIGSPTRNCCYWPPGSARLSEQRGERRMWGVFVIHHKLENVWSLVWSCQVLVWCQFNLRQLFVTSTSLYIPHSICICFTFLKSLRKPSVFHATGIKCFACVVGSMKLMAPRRGYSCVLNYVVPRIALSISKRLT